MLIRTRTCAAMSIAILGNLLLTTSASSKLDRLDQDALATMKRVVLSQKQKDKQQAHRGRGSDRSHSRSLQGGDDYFDQAEEKMMYEYEEQANNAYRGSWYSNYKANNNNNGDGDGGDDGDDGDGGDDNNANIDESYGYNDADNDDGGDNGDANGDDGSNGNDDANNNYYNAYSSYTSSSSATNNVGLDFTKYSIKFHSCYAVKNFDIDDYNGNNDDNEKDSGDKEQQEEKVWPYTTPQIVTYRLCDVDSCKSNSWSGCNNVYGNYAVSLEDYISAHQDHVSEVITQFCSYCRYCTYLKNGLNLTCDYYDECGSYNGLCYDDSEVTDYSQFLECTEVDVVDANAYDYYEEGGGGDGGYGSSSGEAAGDGSDYYDYGQYYQYYQFGQNENAYYEQQQQAYQSGYNNGQGNGGKRNRRRGRGRSLEDIGDRKAYVKVYCDGSIKLGLFTDDTCTNYIGGADAIYETTGLYGYEEELNQDIFSKECLSCTKKKNKYYIMNQQEYEYVQYGNNDGYQDDGDTVYEFCEEIYQESAKCNTRLGEDYYSKQRTCNIVESIQHGNLNERGYLKYYKGGVINMATVVWMFILVILPACIALTLGYLYMHYRRGTIEGKEFDTTLVDSDHEIEEYSVRFSDEEPTVFT